MAIIKKDTAPILDIIASLWQAGVKVNMDSQKYLEGYWDSLTIVHGQPNLNQAKVFLDYEYLSADYLINHIKQAFLARQSLPWCRNLSFEDFCEYVLPYRIGIEAPESWNVHLWAKWQELRDTIKNPDRMQLAKIINNFYSYGMTHMRLFWGYPFDLTASEFERVRLGSCRHSVYYTAMVMRANGLPVGIDFVPQWLDRMQVMNGMFC